MQVVLIDSGGYNIGSVLAALERLQVNARISGDPQIISQASHVILPGVGAAGPAMQKLNSQNLTRLIPTLKQPVLGVCLGMQIMFTHSEEGDTPCLNIFNGCVRKMQGSNEIRIPHMGWNRLRWEQKTPLTDILNYPAWMYFVHSYAAPITDQTIASCGHGEQFAALVQKDNFLAAQFHPERSALAGSALLEYFFSL